MCQEKTASFEQSVSFYYTSDLHRSASFWEDKVGLELVLDQGACKIYRVSQDGFIGFCEQENPTAGDVIITLVTQDVDARCSLLKERGVTFEKPPTFNPKFNIYHAFFRDPSGYLVEIQRFEDPKWPGPHNRS